MIILISDLKKEDSPCKELYFKYLDETNLRWFREKMRVRRRKVMYDEIIDLFEFASNAPEGSSWL